MLADGPTRPLHRNMRVVWLAAAVITTLVATGIAAGVAFAIAQASDTPYRLWIPLVVAVVGIAISIPWVLASFRRWRWDVTDLAMTLRRGVFMHRSTALPFFRIQHIDSNRGPLDQALGMTTLQVHTASVSARLPGIDADEADAVRAELLAMAKQAADSVGAGGQVDAV